MELHEVVHGHGHTHSHGHGHNLLLLQGQDGDDSSTEALLGGRQADDEDSIGDVDGEGEVEKGLKRGDPWRISFRDFPRPPDPKPPLPDAHACPTFHSCLRKFGSSNTIDQYYQQQEEMIEMLKQMDEIAEGQRSGISKEERDKTAHSERIAIQVSNLANLVLFLAKAYVSIRSRSLAIIASTLDSLLDLLSGLILWFTAFSMRQHNPYLYPIGKKRMQPLGILVFASVMATLGLQILLESGRELASQAHQLLLDGDNRILVIAIMIAVTVVKLILLLYCQTFKDEIVRTYAQDHLFDVITNSIGLLAAFLASETKWWIDPLGAILLALYTMRTWSMTVLENVNSLIGKTASPEYLRQITYLCWNHHKDIRQIDTVRAYTFGSSYFAEVDIVLPADMPLQIAHDIGESLQNKLESLPEIERAFVHLDYEVSHKPEHGGCDS